MKCEYSEGYFKSYSNLVLIINEGFKESLHNIKYKKEEEIREKLASIIDSIMSFDYEKDFVPINKKIEKIDKEVVFRFGIPGLDDCGRFTDIEIVGFKTDLQLLA